MFSRAEFDRRIACARDAMASAGVDLLLVDSGELLAWLTGYTVSETMYRAAFLPREGLQALQSGKTGHFVVAPATPMTFQTYQGLLNRIELGNFNVLP
ncbi:aminopeptidase P family N-terminal domain-containing protein [Rhizobium leguminosarum]|uniref:aminopeptidase P family N-terminal domain-containing protein n=1 Tax=Rhizobium leguminosarum TaxID=384 RepID=UPI003F969467